MAEGVEGNDEDVWVDGEDDPPDYFSYNGEVGKIVVRTGSMQKTVLNQRIATLAKSEAKAAKQLCS